MTLIEAYELLDLPEGSDLQQVRQRFIEQHSEYRMQIDNAPTPNMRQRYEKNLALREEAFKLVSGDSFLDDTDDLPSPAYFEKGKEFDSKRNASEYKENAIPEVVSTDHLHELLGLKKTASTEDVATAYLAQKAQLEIECENARITSIKEAYRIELYKLEQAWVSSKASTFSLENGNNGLVSKEVNGSWGYVDRTGKVIIDFKYGYALSFNEGMAAVKRNGKWGYIDETGNIVIDIKFDSCRFFQDSIAAVGFKGKYGFVDVRGNLISEIIYDEIYSFSEQLAAVKLNEKWGFIDKNGKLVIGFKFDKVESFIGESDVFGAADAEVTLNGETYTINKSGERIIKESRQNEEKSSPSANHRFVYNAENKEVSFSWVKPFTITISAFIVYIIMMFFVRLKIEKFIALFGLFFLGVLIVTFIFCKKNNMVLPFLKSRPNLKATLYTVIIWMVLFPVGLNIFGVIFRLLTNH